MATQTQEFKAKSVDEAVAEGLAVWGVDREAVEIEILNKGSRGIFGIGSEPAVVRLTLRSSQPAPQTPIAEGADPETPATAEPPPATLSVSDSGVQSVKERSSTEPPTTVAAAEEDAVETESFSDDLDSDEEEYLDEEDDAIESLNTSVDEDELAAMAADMLDEMIHLMGFKATVTTSWFDEEDDGFDDDDSDDGQDERRHTRYLHLDVEGTDLGALIGRRGETLENIQYLLRLMVNQRIHRWKNIIVDIEHYKERRVSQLTQLAERMAEQVARSGRAISLEPMPANERRIIHMVLRNHPDVYTESYGDGPRRKVHIFARD